MGTRTLAAIASCLAACATAGTPQSGGDDEPGLTVDGAVDAAVDVPPDACPDTDSDSVCNFLDKCAGFDDALDADTDTIADGCDRCPGADDRIDVNANQTPDCVEAASLTINLKSVGGNLWRGWHSSTGGHSTDNENTLTGEYAGATYNSYYVFPMTGFTASVITSVTLELQLESYASGDATETFSVWDVSTPAATLETTVTNATVFADLQSGVQYASATATAGQVTTLLSIPLDAQAATDARAKLGGDFAVGLHLETAPGHIRFGHTGPDATPTVIRVVVKYLP
ncbi:MAG: hypothetical protein M3680_32180 [Myxococcota bacterium]|nr:hypothetical protein [Myxococcota bacterium]